MPALGTPRREALDRLTAALSDALALRLTIDDQMLGKSNRANVRDHMRQLRWMCKSEMLNLKSYVHLFTGTKTFMGFHTHFDILLKYSRKMLANLDRLQ